MRRSQHHCHVSRSRAIVIQCFLTLVFLRRNLILVDQEAEAANALIGDFCVVHIGNSWDAVSYSLVLGCTLILFDQEAKATNILVGDCPRMRRSRFSRIFAVSSLHLVFFGGR